MARSMRGYGTRLTFFTAASETLCSRANCARDVLQLRSWYLIHSQRIAGSVGISVLLMCGVHYNHLAGWFF